MVVTNSITVGTGSVGPVDVGGDALVVIAGPCGLESEQLAHDVAGGVREVCARLAIPWVFKSSFDKANRTSAGAGADRDCTTDSRCFERCVMRLVCP